MMEQQERLKKLARLETVNQEIEWWTREIVGGSDVDERCKARRAVRQYKEEAERLQHELNPVTRDDERTPPVAH
jgi:hypothetical protein